jgi:high frequency lysogenization protein
MIWLRSPTEEQAIALCALFESACGVVELAHSGSTTSARLALLMSAFLDTQSHSTAQLYRLDDDRDGLASGRHTLALLLAKQRGEQRFDQVVQIALGSLYLASKLYKDSAMAAKIGAGIAPLQVKAEQFGVAHNNLFAATDQLYQQTLSGYSYRIQIKGDPARLQQSGVAQRVRSLLFAAVRAGYRWRQSGGHRYHLVLYRRALLAHCQALGEPPRSD